MLLPRRGAVTWNLQGNRSLDVHEVIIAPELRSDERGSYRYVCIAAWGTLARKQANTGIERIIADRTIKADLFNDFKVFYQPQGERVISRQNAGREEWLRADARWIRQDRVTAADDAIGWQRETVSRDLDREIQECIDRYLLRVAAKGYLGDKRGTTLNMQVGAGDDDAHENANNLNFSRTGTQLFIHANTNGNGRWNAGGRFQNVTVPAGATIDSAVVQLNVVDTTSDNTNANIFCNDVDSASDFNTEADVTNRTLTTASVNWSALDVGSGFVSAPDCSTAVQEVIDRAGWASGNNLCVLIRGVSASARNCISHSYNASAADAWKLDIDYTAPAGGTTRRRDLLLLGVGA
jgi:hypothetical protein